MRRATFPVFCTHEAVWCFNCDRSLAAVAARDTGYPVGHGRYAKACVACGEMSTYYDLAIEVAPPAERGEP